MGTLPRRLLLLTAAGMLALPPGWCCILAPAAGVSAARLAVPERPTPCTHCCQEPRADQEEEQPPSRPPCTVCCGDLNVPLSQRAIDFSPDALVAALPPAAALPDPTGAVDAIAPAWPIPPTRALHVLQCVWLC
jgi:hypothetical protein